MKTFKFGIVALCLAALASGTYSFTTSKTSTSDPVLEEWYVDPDTGTRTEQVIGENTCDELTSPICSRFYSVQNGVYTETSAFKTGERQ